MATLRRLGAELQQAQPSVGRHGHRHRHGHGQRAQGPRAQGPRNYGPQGHGRGSGPAGPGGRGSGPAGPGGPGFGAGGPGGPGFGPGGPGFGGFGFAGGQGFGGGRGFGGGHGFGGGRGFGHGPMFGHPFGGGRGRRRRGDVRLALLHALAEEPLNGYQLMQIIEERSGGRWRPSPGSVYPALAQLEDQAFIKAIEQDGQRLFELTDAGREYLSERAEHKPPWEEEDDPASQAAMDIQMQIAQVAQAAVQVAQVADERQMERAGEVLTEARRALYRILAEDGES